MPLWQTGGVKEACGVFGVYAPGATVSQLIFDGLFALQHRGQESAGMAVSDGETITVVKDMGLVTSVFDERTISSLSGHLGVGHTRYSTRGKSTWQNAQPVFRSAGHSGFALGHNGNLTNTDKLAAEAGMLPGFVTSDSDLIAELVARALEVQDARSPGLLDAVRGGEGAGEPCLEGHEIAAPPNDELLEALRTVLPTLEGAFSLGVVDADHLFGIRDPNGFRPLCLGRLGEEGWVLASETPALDVVGAEFVRELDPGEMVVIDEFGPRSIFPFPPERIDPKLCLFEFVYFARPDSVLLSHEVHAARVRMGQLLARESAPDADLVIGVPDSGIPAAQGFAQASGIPYGQGLVKNRYIGRTFIAPTEAARVDAVRRKLNPLRESIETKRLVVVDDSIVRGTTTRQMVKMLRDCGASEVHLRVSSPPFRWPCFYGIDTPSRQELLAAKMAVSEIAEHLGADSIAYLSLESLLSATGAPVEGFCSACLTGHYPTSVPLSDPPADLR
jgi:amidophosphoribosyltransferase